MFYRVLSVYTSSSNMTDEPDTTHPSSVAGNWVTWTKKEKTNEEIEAEIAAYEEYLRDKKWYDWYKQIKEWGRAAVRQMDLVISQFIKKIPFYLKVCTQRIPSIHFHIHNSSVRFIREGL